MHYWTSGGVDLRTNVLFVWALRGPHASAAAGAVYVCEQWQRSAIVLSNPLLGIPLSKLQKE